MQVRPSQVQANGVTGHRSAAFARVGKHWLQVPYISLPRCHFLPLNCTFRGRNSRLPPKRGMQALQRYLCDVDKGNDGSVLRACSLVIYKLVNRFIFPTEIV